MLRIKDSSGGQGVENSTWLPLSKSDARRAFVPVMFATREVRSHSTPDLRRCIEVDGNTAAFGSRSQRAHLQREWNVTTQRDGCSHLDSNACDLGQTC